LTATLTPTTHQRLLSWIDEVAALTTPDQVVFCDGSESEWTRITDDLYFLPLVVHHYVTTTGDSQLLGLIRHLTSVERYWLSIVGGGLDVPNRWESPDPDIDFRLSEQDTPESVVEEYQHQWELSRQALAGKAAGDPSTTDGDKTVRWLLTHLVQETARHVGHLDVLREFADGTTGE